MERNQPVPATLVVSLALIRVAVDERAMVHRMAQASHLVLQLAQPLAASGIDDVLEAKLMVPHLFSDELSAPQKLIGLGKVRHIDSDVVAVIRGKLFITLPEEQPLVAADENAGGSAIQLYRRAQDLLIKRGDAFSRAGLHAKLDRKSVV